MKYIDLINLVGLNSYLDSIDLGDSIVRGSLEAYSCKAAGSDKKIMKSLDRELEILSTSANANSGSHLLQHAGLNIDSGATTGTSYNSTSNAAAYSLSPSNNSYGVSPFGPLSSSSSRKTMIYLIQTLNASFPDYDFSDSKPDQFRREPSLALVTNSINTTFSGIIKNYATEFEGKLWPTLDQEIDLDKCEIYSYIPESNDPFTEFGILWSFNYFFYNRSMKRIIFFKCKLLSKLPILDSKNPKKMAEMIDDEDIEDYYYNGGDEDDFDMEMN